MSLLRVSLLCRAGLSRPVLSVLSHKSYSTNNEVSLQSPLYLIVELHECSLTQPVGFIGLGNMGGPMANNLLQKGHKLVVYDIAEAAVSQAVSAGAVKATSPAEVCVMYYDINVHFKLCIAGGQASQHHNYHVAGRWSCA